MSVPLTIQSRIRGSLLGLAVGDALGTSIEFSGPGPHQHSQMAGGGPFHLQPGQWTDDTSLALCLAVSLVECHGFDACDQMQRYLRWRDEGYLSSTGACFDIGNTTSRALDAFIETGNPFSGPADVFSAGNGSLMRLAPVPLYFYRDPREAVRLAGESSRTTHGAGVAVDACRYLAALLVGALQGTAKEDLLSAGYAPAPGLWQEQPLNEAIAAIAAGSFKHKQPPQIRGNGYVVNSLEAALWAFAASSSFRDGCLLAINLGEDADTTGAVYGQLAGAFYGIGAIPQEWLQPLAMQAFIADLADKLAAG
ncbi:MAG: ADP-ribosylglycohydrolase family protein [Chloroflexi bacterium]|nr:ADP-ribosylglycohydrolase family protein [Chloroflexota bacterium]